MLRFALAIALCVMASLPAAATSSGNFREGYQALLRKDYDKAIAHLTRAIEIGDLTRANQALAYHYRGALYLKRERVGEAIADLDRALTLNPRLATAYGDRGIAHRKNGDYELAIADYGEAIRLWPEWHDWYIHRGLVFNMLGRYDDAIADYGTALSLRPRLVNALVARADAYLAKGEYENAISDFQHAAMLDRDVAANYPGIAERLVRARATP
jgi:tetratricopeptide (TPR) repeat protein